MSDFVSWFRRLAKAGGKGVVNNIDARCLGRAADEIERLRTALSALLPYADNSDSPGGCNGKYADFCEHCSAIKSARAALEQTAKHCNGGYVRDGKCDVCGAEPNEDCRATFR